MKICFLTFACPQWDLDQVIDAALRHSYHGIEFRCDAGQAHGVEVTAARDFVNSANRKLSEAGLEAPCLATSIKLAEINSISDALPRIELAAAIGAKSIRVFCGEPQGEIALNEVVVLVGSRLRELADLSSPFDIDVLLETHDTLHRGVDSARAVRIADHPHVGINYDNMHPYRMHEDLDTTFDALQGLIRHTHIHDAEADDELHRAIILPLDKGDMPMDDMLRRLVASGFDDYVGGEWFGNEYGTTPDESLGAYRREMELLLRRNGMEFAATCY
jgi:sugar phosphate isomerase/epimerase